MSNLAYKRITLKYIVKFLGEILDTAVSLAVIFKNICKVFCTAPYMSFLVTTDYSHDFNLHQNTLSCLFTLFKKFKCIFSFDFAKAKMKHSWMDEQE